MDAEQRKKNRAAAAAAKLNPGTGVPPVDPAVPPAEVPLATPPVETLPSPPPATPPVDVRATLGDNSGPKGIQVIHIFEKLSDGSEVHVRTFSSDPTLNGKAYKAKAQEFLKKFQDKGKSYFIPEE